MHAVGFICRQLKLIYQKTNFELIRVRNSVYQVPGMCFSRLYCCVEKYDQVWNSEIVFSRMCRISHQRGVSGFFGLQHVHTFSIQLSYHLMSYDPTPDRIEKNVFFDPIPDRNHIYRAPTGAGGCNCCTWYPSTRYFRTAVSFWGQLGNKLLGI